MTIKSVLTNLNFSPEKEEIKYLKKETGEFVELLKEGISKKKIDAEVFVGGSFAKGTLARFDEYYSGNKKFSVPKILREGVYDVDIFIRFDWKYESLSDRLEKVLNPLAKKMNLSLIRLHGSRDYFKIIKGNLTFEIIPVIKIKKVGEARNVTDLSYFHVNYVRRKIEASMKKEVSLAKRFCRAQGVYGAESYIRGFSGYGIECLIIYYKTFEKMLKDLLKVKDRKIIDPAKFYKKTGDILIELNESRLHSPVILIDPTWKERNVLAALSLETFKKFQKAAKDFLEFPSEKFFAMKKFNGEEMKKLAKKRKAEFVKIVLETNRQEGDIAGTKMKKFSNFLISEIGKYFNILEKEFIYSVGQSAELYFVARSKKEIVRIGPPLKMKKEVREFKSKNKRTFVKNGMMHSKIKIDFTVRRFLEKFKKNNKGKIIDMGIISLRASKT